MEETQQKFKLSVEQRTAARERQRAHRERVKQQEATEFYEQHVKQAFDEKRRALNACSLLEIEPFVLAENAADVLQVAREFARKLNRRDISSGPDSMQFRLVIQPGETILAFFQRVFVEWILRGCPALNRQRDQLCWQVCFGFRKEDVQPIVEIVGSLDGVNDPIQVDLLTPIPFRCSEFKPTAAVDETLEKHHRAHVERQLAESEIKRGDFTVEDSGTRFYITAKSEKERGEKGYSFSKAWPGDLWINWRILFLADEYLRNHPDDSSFDQTTRERVSRVLGYRKLKTTHFDEVGDGLSK